MSCCEMGEGMVNCSKCGGHTNEKDTVGVVLTPFDGHDNFVCHTCFEKHDLRNVTGIAGITSADPSVLLHEVRDSEELRGLREEIKKEIADRVPASFLDPIALFLVGAFRARYGDCRGDVPPVPSHVLEILADFYSLPFGMTLHTGVVQDEKRLKVIFIQGITSVDTRMAPFIMSMDQLMKRFNLFPEDKCVVETSDPVKWIRLEQAYKTYPAGGRVIVFANHRFRSDGFVAGVIGRTNEMNTARITVNGLDGSVLAEFAVNNAMPIGEVVGAFESGFHNILV